MKLKFWTGLAAIAIFATAMAAASPPPSVGKGHVLTTAGGHSLYTYDADVVPGQSACTNSCASVWPPYLATAKTRAKAPFSLITRGNGQRQWAWHGKPLYSYAADQASGDTYGDGVNGRWHLARAGSPPKQ